MVDICRHNLYDDVLAHVFRGFAVYLATGSEERRCTEEETGGHAGDVSCCSPVLWGNVWRSDDDLGAVKSVFVDLPAKLERKG